MGFNKIITGVIKIKKVLPIVLLAVLIITPIAHAGSAFHVELDTALVTDMTLRDASFSNTFRIGAKGESYTLDVAMAYNGEDPNSFRGIKGVGPSFSLKGWGVRFQLDGFVYPNEYARASLKYKVSDMVNTGIFAQSNLRYNYDFGLLVGIEY